MSERTLRCTKHDAIHVLVSKCETWTRKELLQFAYDKLYDEYQQMSEEELVIKLVKAVEKDTKDRAITFDPDLD